MPNTLILLVCYPKSSELQISSKMFYDIFVNSNVSWTTVYYDLIG